MRLEIATDPFRLTCRWPDGTPFSEDDPALGMGIHTAPAPNHIPDTTRDPGHVRCAKRLAPGERILGAGERTAPLDRRGQRIIYWNTDPPQPHGPDTTAMYASIPFWLGLRQGRAYGIFLDSVWRAELDAGATTADTLTFGADGGDLTYYIFAGPTPAAVLARYADLTGHMPMPPRWALGYGQCRWSYYPEPQVRDIAARFRQGGIPCDHLWLDIDYMDGYRDFTFDPHRFPDPAAMLADLNAQGYKVVTIIDPGIKADPTDPTFHEGLERDYFIRNADGSLFIGVVWPGECVFPDFTRADVREWWGERQRVLLDAGVTAIWDDMNEPALTDRFVPDGATPRGTTLATDTMQHPDGYDGPIPHRALHNAYGMQMARATHEGLLRHRPDQRPFVLSRSGYAGVQRYAALWTGDNQSTWEHMRLAARMCLALGLSGVPFVGFDTGGFWLDATGPLLVRFTQLGSVFPFFRNHSALATKAQEPWAFGQPFETLIRDAIELRYRLLPYLYTVFAEAARTGAPIARPFAYAFPDEDTLATIEDQHLLGGDLLCAPVIEDNQPQRIVQFPRGAWRDWRTGERIVGPLRRRVDSPLDVLPLFVREGAILPLGPVMQFVGERPDDPITLAAYLGPEADSQATGSLYEDDGATPAYQRGSSRLTTFTASRTGTAISPLLRGEGLGERFTFIAAQPTGDYDAEPRDWLVELHLPFAAGPHDPRPTIAAASLDGRPLTGGEIVARRYETLIRIPLGRISAPFTMEVTLA
jgi:alpha-glucosidase